MLPWYEQDKTTAVIKMYTNIGWWNNDAAAFSALFETLDAQYDNIIIRVHCFGGNVIEGNAIYNILNGSNAHVTWRIEGVCMSMGTIDMLGADVVEMVDNGILMVHSPSGGAYGTAKDMLAAAKLLGIMEKGFKKRYAEKTGKPASDVAAWFDGSDHFFDAEEAKAIGLVDAVIPAVVKNVKAIKMADDENQQPDYETIYNRYAALLEDGQEGQAKPKAESRPKAPGAAKPTAQQVSKPNTDTIMKELLITMFALTGVTKDSSDAEIAAAVKVKMDALQSQADAQALAGVNAAITAVETATGKPFEATYKTTLQAIGEKSGIEALQMVLANHMPAKPAGPATPPAPPAPNIMSMIGGGGPAAAGAAGDRSGWKWDDYQKNDPEALAEMKTSQKDAFIALYKAKYKAEPDLS